MTESRWTGGWWWEGGGGTISMWDLKRRSDTHPWQQLGQWRYPSFSPGWSPDFAFGTTGRKKKKKKKANFYLTQLRATILTQQYRTIYVTDLIIPLLLSPQLIFVCVDCCAIVPCALFLLTTICLSQTLSLSFLLSLSLSPLLPSSFSPFLSDFTVPCTVTLLATLFFFCLFCF